ncbi:5239_t:CDS:10 [Entrophospora sp. SA101]|nr:5239_t:CDS:10 [Entrophospora sp. SA101]CAJ0926477.1 4817_t:CDS:10 [Entrophospora sp. SA101]
MSQQVKKSADSPDSNNNNHDKNNVSESEGPIASTVVVKNGVYKSEQIEDRKSVFIAYAKRVENKQQVELFKDEMERENNTATHNIIAYRIMKDNDGATIEEFIDDGEKYAGNRVLNLLKSLDVKNVVIIVSRWYGGVMLGPARFDHIEKCAREVLDKGNFVTGKRTTPVRGGSSTGKIIVNGCQRGNPILQHICNVTWEYGECIPDYVLGQTTCALFLSLRYHRLHPEYIYNRIQQLKYKYLLRILLVLVDIDSHQDSIRELSKVCVINNFTVILAWSQEEAGRYLETYKSFEYKPPDMIMEKVQDDYLSRLTHSMTQIKSVNKTDVITLASSARSLKRLMSMPSDEIGLCPGIGEQKVKRIFETFNEPFSLNELNVEDVHESGVDADINIIINWNLLGNVGNNLIFLKMILSVYIDSDAGILKSTFNVDNIANDTNGKLQNNFNVLMKSRKNSYEIDMVDSEDGYAATRGDCSETEKDEYLRRSRRPGRPAGQKKQQELQLGRNKSNNSASKKQNYKDNYYINSIDENDVLARDRAGQTNLHKACQSGNMERTKDLIKRGSDINARDHAGWTSLHEASLNGHLEIVYYLLENGADANAASLDDCDTPLHDACAKGHYDVVCALLEYGADPDKANAKEEKPEDHSSEESIIKLLKTPVEYVKIPEIIHYNSSQRYSPSLYITDFDSRRTSLISGKRGRPRIKQEDIKDSGLSKRSENQKTTRRRVSLRDSKIREGDLHNNGARAIVSANDVLRMDLKSRDSSGRSNLHIHAKRGNAEMVANMIEAGAMINGTDNHGRTPLHEAASEGHNTTMEILLAFGADINVKDKKLNTPLHDAAHKGHIEVVKILLQNNAQPDGKNIDEFDELAISPPRDSMEIQTPDYLRIEFADKYIGPLYTVQLDTTSTGYPLTTPTIPPTATLFVVDLQVELFLQWKVNSLTTSQPNLTRRLITTIEKERLWPLLRSIVWAPPKSIRPSEMGILEDARKIKFLEYQMYFVKYEEVLKLMEIHFKNSFTKSISTMALDISDYPNLDVALYDFSSKLPLTPTSPTTPLLNSQWGVTTNSPPLITASTTTTTALFIKKEHNGKFRDNNNISNTKQLKGLS